MSNFDFIEIIKKKREGYKLSREEIALAVSGYTKGEIPDYQMSSFLMAVYFQGMDRSETLALIEAMIDSGETIDLSYIQGVKVDKHSTGGVGDKVSLVLAPLVAASGIVVPMMSGRGLGHTGGTLDKLESINGLRTDLSEKEFIKQVEKIGFAMMGQTERVVPADRKMYALRDVTGTVSSIPLICASILSKKKAEGADCLVLDVKVGRGAFFRSMDEAVKLAKELVSAGNCMSLKTVALITGMDEPLGRSIGNWLEVREAVSALKGEGPEDLMEAVITLGGLMLVLGERVSSVKDGMELIQHKLDSGEGYYRFLEMVKMQGGDVSVVEDPDSYPECKFKEVVKSPCNGYISDIDGYEIGRTAVILGAGRMRKEDEIDHCAGIVIQKKTGDGVGKGERLAFFYTNRYDVIDEARVRLLKAFKFSESEVKRRPLIRGFIDEGLIKDSGCLCDLSL